MPSQNIELKNLCEEVFDNYNILDVERFGNNVFLRVKRKRYSLQDAFKKLYGVVQSSLEINNRVPA